jgi:hypothetical protein
MSDAFKKLYEAFGINCCKRFTSKTLDRNFETIAVKHVKSIRRR